MLVDDRSLKDLLFDTNIDPLAHHHGPIQAKKSEKIELFFEFLILHFC